MRVLVAEDEKTLNSLIVKVLTKEGMSVDSALSGNEGLDFILAAEYDIIILDVMMPGMDGFTLVQKIRERGICTPVLFLTARDGVEDRVKGLDLGADDYLVKPFAFEELLARIRALTRKYTGSLTSLHEVSNLRVDESTKTVTRGGVELSLSAKEYALLLMLIKNPGRIISREQIEESLYDFGYEGASNVIDVHLSSLRKKVDAPGQAPLIHTKRGFGYYIKDES